MINARQLADVEARVAEAVADGARVLTGGRRSRKLKEGFFFEPTILVDVRPEMRIVATETFGPTMPIMKVRGIEEAIALGGPYQDFRDAVSAATTDKLHVARLPSSSSAIDWPLLLSWLTRDQEARFAEVDEWRSARSESTSPNPPAANRT